MKVVEYTYTSIKHLTSVVYFDEIQDHLQQQGQQQK